MYKVGVLGAGTWGMAVARVLCNRHHSVMVWSALPQEIEYIQFLEVKPTKPSLNDDDCITLLRQPSPMYLRLKHQLYT